MKIYCKENGFLFLIYDVKTLEYYRFDEKDNLIKTNLRYTEFKNDFIKIFKNNNDIEGVKKVNYYFKVKDPMIIGKIKKNKNFSKEIINENFEFKIDKKKVIFYNNKNIIMDIEDIGEINDEIESEEETSNIIEENEEIVENDINLNNNIDLGLEENDDSIIEENLNEEEEEEDEKEKEDDKLIKKRKKNINKYVDLIEKNKKKMIFKYEIDLLNFNLQYNNAKLV